MLGDAVHPRQGFPFTLGNVKHAMTHEDRCKPVETTIHHWKIGVCIAAAESVAPYRSPFPPTPAFVI